VQVYYGEVVANHTDPPESCAAYREVCREALTGERAGQPLSHEIFLIEDADVVTYTESKTDGCDIASARTVLRGRRPWHARTLLTWEPGDLQFDQLQSRGGPRREGEEPYPVTVASFPPIACSGTNALPQRERLDSMDCLPRYSGESSLFRLPYSSSNESIEKRCPVTAPSVYTLLVRQVCLFR
jgi:hypothetical protein